MFQMIESWRTMPRDVFTAILHILLYTKQIGSRQSLDAYMYTVGCCCKAYYAAVDEVRTSEFAHAAFGCHLSY